MRFSYLLLVLLLEITSFSLEASSSLSYSGRLVNTDGSPVTGPVNLKFELAYTNSSGVGPVLCDQLIEEVPLTNGVFHVKLSFSCPSSTITKVLSSTPAGESAAIRVTNESTGKAYAYQALHSLPFSQVSKQLAQMGATNGQVLTWNGSEWAPANGATTDGTVKDIQTGSGLMGGPITDSGTISIAPGGVVDAHLAAGIDPAKLSGARDSTKYLKGDNTWSSFGDDVLATIITGFSTASSAVVTATDSILEALGKIQAQLSNKIDNTGGTLAVGTIDGVPTPVLPSQIVNKQYVDDVVGGVNASQWTTAVNDIFYTTGNVGIGTSTPGSKLDVSGGVQISKANTHLVLKDTDEVGGEFAYIERNSTALIFGTNNGATSTIGLTVKDGNVEVAGQVKIAGGTPGAGKILTSDASGLASWSDPASTTPTGAAGGDLSGTYPDPTIANGAITDAKVAAGANIDQSKIANLTTDLGNKQATDSDLTALAGLGTTGVLVRTGTGTATTRSIIGTANRVSVTNGDGVSGDPTINISSTLLPSPVAGDAGKILKATGADTTSWESFLSSDITTALGFTPINKAGDSITSGVFDFSGTAFVRVQDPVLATDVANKQYVDDKFSSGSNQWSESGGNVYRPTGNVGIGTSAPSQALEVRGVGIFRKDNNFVGGTNLAVQNLDSTAGILHNAGIAWQLTQTGQTASISAGKILAGKEQEWTTTASTNDSYLSFQTASDGAIAEKLRVTSDGNVGIGTVAPGYLLEIDGDGNNTDIVKFTRGNGNSSGLIFQHYSIQRIDGTGTPNDMLINPNGGNVGIGTISPTAKLQIDHPMNNGASKYSWTSGAGLLINNPSFANGGEVSKIVMNTASGGYNSGAIIHVEGAGSYNAGQLVFSTGWDAAGNGTERMRIKNDGKIGIGTATPAIKLDVAGAVRVGTDATACAAGIAGAIRYNGGNVEYCNGTAWTAFAASGAGITSFNGLTAGTQTFAIGTSGTAPLFNSATSTHTLNIPMAATAGVTAGLLSKTDYDAFNNKLGTTLNSGNIWVGNGSNVATAVAPSSDVSMTNAGAFTVTKLQGRAVTTTAPGLGSFLKWDNLLSQWAPSAFTTCAGTSEVMHYNSLTDTWSCDTIGINNILPTQTGNSGKVLTTNGTTASWQTPTSGMGGSGTTNYLTKFTAASTLGNSLIFDNGTSVGIGTTSPLLNFHVRRTVDAATPIAVFEAYPAVSANGDAAKIDLAIKNSAGESRKAKANIAAVATDITAGGEKVDLAFSYGSSNGNTFEGMRLTSSGNVGIGTTTPATMLDVAGSIRPGADASPCVAGLTGAIRNNAGVIEFCNGTAWTAFASGSTGDFLKDGSVAMTGPFKAADGTPAAPGITFGDDPDTGISNQSANTLTFSVAGTEKFTVSSAGVYTSGATLLQSWKVASQSNDNSSYTSSSISSKVPLTTGFVKAENVSAGNNKMAMFELAVTNTDSTVQNAYFGAFANGSTYTPSIVIGQQTGATAYDERMRIDASGNVGIGTTTPATMLDVAGAIRPGADVSPCVAGLTGAIRNNAGVIEFCNGTAWTAFATGTAGDFLKDGSVAMTGAFKAANGTAAAPSISFSSETNTGFYYKNATEVGWSVTGGLRFNFGTNIVAANTGGAGITSANGTATNAAFFFQGDANTGMFSPTLETLGFTTNGAEKMRITSTGNVGIGTTTPLRALHISNTSAATVILENPANAANLKKRYISTESDGDLAFGMFSDAMSPTSHMTIGSSGNVGIGTTTPATMLDVAGAIRPGTDISPCVAGLTGAIRNNAGVIEFCNGTAWTAFATGVASSGTNTSVQISNGSGGFASSTWFNYTSGKLGIGPGTTAPTNSLTVIDSGADAPIAKFQNGDSRGAGIEVKATNTGGADFWIQATADNATEGGGKLSFRDRLAADASRMVIDSVGNVGIGTASPTAKLDVNGVATMNASTESITTYSDTGTAYTIPNSLTNIRRLTLTGNATVTLPGFTSATPKVFTLTVFLKQDATGNRTVSFIGSGSDTVKWDSGTAPSIATTASKITIVQFTKPSDETVWYASKVWQE